MLGELRPACPIDLHLHTTLSDGRFPPEEVLRRCAEAGLEVVALTDHDLASPLPPGPHQVGDRVIHLLAGAELSGTHEGVEYHLLVYFPGAVPQGFREFCRRQCEARSQRFADAVRSLDLGLPLPEAPACRGDQALTRYHLAQALVQVGAVGNTSEAFARYLHPSHGHVRAIEVSFVEAIRTARAWGGLTSWAHPPLDALRDHLGTFVEAGLQGLEAIRPHVNGKARKAYSKAARRHQLYLTGGSDWHGWKDGELGLFRVDAAEIRGFLDALRAAELS